MTKLRVVGAVIVKDGLMLACRRTPERSAGGKWEFPGGKIEPGETAESALIREVREELGVEISVGPLLDRSSTLLGDRTIELSCYFATILGDPPRTSTDHDELRWVTAHEIALLDWSAPDLPAVSLLTQSAAASPIAPNRR